MKKKTIALLLILCLAFCLAGCRSETGQTALPASGEEDHPAAESAGEYDMPDIRFFNASLLDGSAETSEDLLGGKDVTVINCWATWCPPCLDEMDELADFAKTLPDNVQLLTFCVDGTTHGEECQRILDEAGFEGITLISATGDLNTLLEQMQYVPTTIFVDSVGRQLCNCLIGSQDNLENAYKERINDGLKAMGKGEWK